jgi:predicted RNA binding protein YcfA (HicA-like mRNA interferase family)
VKWQSHKARQVLTALLKIGWQIKRTKGSHRTLSRQGFDDYIFAFHDDDEIGPQMMSRIAKRTGLSPDDYRQRR